MPATTHLSYWHETAGGLSSHFPPLETDINVDVAILGAGITGLTAAAHLQHSGFRVAVLEAGRIGSGTTGFTSGHLDATTDLSLSRMILEFGQSAASAVTTATREAIDQIEARCKQWPDCEFSRVPSYQYTESGTGLDGLHRQVAAARKLSFNCWFTRQVPLPFACAGAVLVAEQGRFHSQRYLQHLAAEIHDAGCSIYENTAASPPKGGAPTTIETDGGHVTAKTIIVATHSPYLGISEFEFRVFPYQSYVIGARVDDDVADALYWDDADPYHYIRLASPNEPGLVLIGGCDHKTGQPLDERQRFAELEQYATDHFSVRSIEHQWSAQLYNPADGLPHVGRVPGMKDVFVATGFAGTGLTWGTVAGTLIARIIQGQRHPLEAILAPGRLTLIASARDVIAENLDVMRRFVVDRFAGGQPQADEQIPPGCGKVVSRSGKLVAMYRDPSGALFRLSPECTHAGCIVHWNEAERTWDCPCHGGRYTCDGRRFCGPPAKDLEPIREPEASHV
ncbi:MAG TPA: FAD-dependent oxidoreductase [Pirellulaceae bacterium]|nr:FAD-dependent oxidoreductase [Pirellulaceae bacterium]